ncbi:MAG TPA: GFA family protein [Burkholderiales bacterium]
MSQKKTYRGSCHCGAVRFEAELDLAAGTAKCNCSICLKTRSWMAFVPEASVRLLAGEGELRDYTFGKKTIHHRFCGQCGVRPFSQAADPQGNRMYALKVNCLDGVEPRELAGAPVKYMNMLHDDFKSSPEETRHL